MLNRLKGISSRAFRSIPESMKENMAKSFGLHNSQRVMLALTDKGMTREDAYSPCSERTPRKSWKQKKDFKALLLKDKAIRKHLSPAEINGIFNISFISRISVTSFGRVFGKADHIAVAFYI